MKSYKALFLAGDAVLASKDFFTPEPESESFSPTTIILDLMDVRQDLQEKYGCPVSLTVYFVKESSPVVSEIQSSRHWWNLVADRIRRISSFFF